MNGVTSLNWFSFSLQRLDKLLEFSMMILKQQQSLFRGREVNLNYSIDKSGFLQCSLAALHIQISGFWYPPKKKRLYLIKIYLHYPPCHLLLLPHSLLLKCKAFNYSLMTIVTYICKYICKCQWLNLFTVVCLCIFLGLTDWDWIII